MPDSEARLASMIARYSPAVAALGTAAIARLRRELPNAFVFVYDNYNALAVGFGEAAAEAAFLIPPRNGEGDHPKGGGGGAVERRCAPAPPPATPVPLPVPGRN